MKKRILNLILVLCMVCTMVQSTAFAANTRVPINPVELGTLAEYQNVLDSTFDENGLRTAKVGYFTKEGMLGEKVGILNQYGNWVAQPIYDEIKPTAHDMRLKIYERGAGISGNRVPETPVVFIGGYTQAIRDGKMGLLNQKGEEVIPCKYDYVQMPSEGMAAVYNKKDAKSHYLGYWSLEEKREVVAPNKYITGSVGVVIGAPAYSMESVRVKSSGDFNQIHDFMDGYALVTLSAQETNQFSYGGIRPATIIDKKGKEILPKPYDIHSAHLIASHYDNYGQKGPYLVISVAHHQEEYTKNGQTMIAHDYVAAGVATTRGIIVEPKYSEVGYVKQNDTIFGYRSPASFAIFPESNLICAPVPSIGGRLVSGGMNFINFKGETVLGQMGSFHEESKVIIAGNSIYSPTRKLIARVGDKEVYEESAGKDGNLIDFISPISMKNGYTFGYDYGKWVPTTNGDGYDPTTVYAIKADGTKLNLTKLMNWSLQKHKSHSNFSTGGCLWVENNEGKWGLLDITGKKILPFVYDSVEYDAWADKGIAYAIVTQKDKKGMIGPKGEILTPVEYSSFTREPGHTSAIAERNEKKGLIDLKTGKVTLPVRYDGILSFSPYYQLNADYFGTGVCVAFKGKNVVFVDKTGNEVYTRNHSESQKHLNLTKEATLGLYDVYEGEIDNRGRVIIPTVERRNATLNYAASSVIYTKGGKVYRESANAIERNYAVKSYGRPTTTEDAVKYQKADMEAYQKAVELLSVNGTVPQQQLYDKPMVKFISTPDKNEYSLGDTFDTTGFQVQYQDIYGNGTDISDKIDFDVNGTKIYAGYKFTTTGKKTVNCSYNGKKLNNFVITVFKKVEQADIPLTDGDYYMQLMGKYVTVVNGKWMELQDEKPSEAFTVKHLGVDKETGHHLYHIIYNNTTVYYHGNGNGAQLISGGALDKPHKWRISKYSDFWTMRDEKNQSMAVNASGASSKNNTKVTIWKYTGKAPEHAKIKFIKVD